MSGGRQTQVYTQPAPAVAGDFASKNTNRFSVLSGPTALVAGSTLTVGYWGWVDYNGVDFDNAPALVYNSGAGNPNTLGGPKGFLAREQQGLNVTYLSDATQTIPAGFPVTLYIDGDFWVVNNNASTYAQVGMKAYADIATGKTLFGWAGAPSTTTQTSATITAGTGATFTGSIAGNILTITGAVTNTLYLGALLSGGSGMVAGTQIVAQLTGATGAAGTYALSVPEQTVASASLTATPYLAAGTGGAGIIVGSVITATSAGSTGTIVGGVVTAIITAGTNVVVALPSPGTGTNTTATLTFEQTYETKWRAQSAGAAGELIKISSNSNP